MDQQATKSRPNGSLIQHLPEAEAFYSEVLQLMAKSDIPLCAGELHRDRPADQGR
jgi:hypothetical protein